MVEIKYPKNARFECLRCTKCCGDTPQKKRQVLLLTREAKKIEKISGMRLSGFAAPVSSPKPFKYVMKKKNRKCVFLKNGACSIYMHRPLLCRFYPFSVQKHNGGYIFKASDECPGIGLGDALKEDDFREMLMEANGVLAKAF